NASSGVSTYQSMRGRLMPTVNRSKGTTSSRQLLRRVRWGLDSMRNVSFDHEGGSPSEQRRAEWDHIPPVATRISSAKISLGSLFTRKITSVIRKNGPALLSCGTYVSGSDPTRVARKAGSFRSA